MYFLLLFLQGHYEACPKYPLPCGTCGKENIPRDMVSDFSPTSVKQGLRSGESTCLPPMWLGFDSQTDRR